MQRLDLERPIAVRALRLKLGLGHDYLPAGSASQRLCQRPRALPSPPTTPRLVVQKADGFRYSRCRLSKILTRISEKPRTAQPSKYQCDGNDEHDAGGNHQDLEGVIAWNVIVCTLYALHGHDCTPCQQRRFISWLLICVGMRAAHSASSLFGQTFGGSAVIAARPIGQPQRLRRDGFCGRQTSYEVLHMPH